MVGFVSSLVFQTDLHRNSYPPGHASTLDVVVIWGSVNGGPGRQLWRVMTLNGEKKKNLRALRASSVIHSVSLARVEREYRSPTGLNIATEVREPNGANFYVLPPGVRIPAAFNRKARRRCVLLEDVSERVDAYAEWVLLDPGRPRFVQRVFQSVWTALAPTVKELFLAVLTTPADAEDDVAGGGQLGGGGESTDHSVAGMAFVWGVCRQSISPNDTSIWSRTKNPLWWALNLCCACTWCGINAATFGLILCFIDREDHWQLSNFIFKAKTFQFVFGGVVGLIHLAFAFAHCIIVLSPRKESATCGQTCGPGSTEASLLGFPAYISILILACLLQVSLPLIAFFHLQHSVPKGGSCLKGAQLIGKEVLWEEQIAIDTQTQLLMRSPELGPVEAEEGNETELPSKVLVFSGEVLAYHQSSGEFTINLNTGYDSHHDRHRGTFGPRRTGSRSEGIEETGPCDDESTAIVTAALHDRNYYVLQGRSWPFRFLMAYDLCACCLVAAGWLFFLHQASTNGGTPLPLWKWWASVQVALVTWSLLALPFAVLATWPWRNLFTHARPTGYDCHGFTVPMADALNRRSQEEGPLSGQGSIDRPPFAELQSGVHRQYHGDSGSSDGKGPTRSYVGGKEPNRSSRVLPKISRMKPPTATNASSSSTGDSMTVKPQENGEQFQSSRQKFLSVLSVIATSTPSGEVENELRNEK